VERANARNNNAFLHGVQKKELYDDKEQEEHQGAFGAPEVLRLVPQAHQAQGGEIGDPGSR
jgi:hypothetical protein